MRLESKHWEAFFIGGENGLFSIESTSSGIDKNKLLSTQGDIPYITRTNSRNGIDSFIGTRQSQQFKKNYGNVITIGLDTQTIFYQSHDFLTGQNIQILSSKYLNKEVAMFVIPLLNIQMEKFNWGGNGATLTRLNRTKIMLPVNEEFNPDWEFMEKYIKQETELIIRKLLNTLERKKNLNIEGSTISGWREFWLDQILDIKSGTRLTKSNQTSGNRPFIGASDNNNGITNFISNTNKSLDSNVLGVNYNGSVVENFYHPYEALFSDDVKRLHLKNERYRNKYVYLFLKQVILQQKIKYTYGYKFNAKRMSRQKIMLPVYNNGQVAYKYMEDIMIKFENEHLNAIFTYYSPYRE